MSDAPILSRPLRVDDVPREGVEIDVRTTPQEREALARDFGIVAIEALESHLFVRPKARGVQVSGRVEARIRQTCVVSLDEFDTDVEEPVEVSFSRDAAEPQAGETHEGTPDQPDPPDPIVDGRIDLGVLTAEFLALSLDPYPRKPGVAFEEHVEDAGEDSPFAALARLRGETGD